jgi:hypothetical protein
LKKQKKLSGMDTPSLKVYLMNYLPGAGAGAGASAGFSGAGIGASVDFSGAGASAGFSAFLQPLTPSENDTSSNSDKIITKTFFINCHLLSLKIPKNLKFL